MMKRREFYIFSTGLILFFLLFTFDKLYATNNLRLIEQKGAVVKIVTYDDSGSKKGWATGYFINDKGHILTHASVIKDAYSAEVFSDFNYYGDVEVLKIDEDRDLALISVKPAEESYIVIGSEAIPEPGEKIFAIGYHFGAEKIITEGEIIFSESSETAPEVFSTTIPALPGVDYGPLLNSEGKIIGTALPSHKNDTKVYGTNIAHIREFLLMPQNVEKHLQHPRSRIWYKKYIKWFQVNVIGGVISFLFLEGPGKVVNIFIAIIIIVFVIQWIIEKINFQKK
jgi:hypothetical protein